MIKTLLRFAYVGIAVATAFWLGGCASADHDHEGEGTEAHGEHDHEAEGHDHEGEDHEHEGEGHDHDHEAAAGIIKIEPEDAKRYGITTQIAEAGDFADAVKVAAEVLPSASDMATASAPTAGMIRLAPGITQGAVVKQGQVIAHVRATGVSGGDANAAAKVAVDNAKRELDRLTPLLADGLVTRGQYNEALAAYEAAKAAYSPAAAAGTVVAPRGGVITQVAAGEGAFVQTGDPVALVAANGRLTLRALLPARKASLLPTLSGAVITPTGASGEAIDLSAHGGRVLSSSAASASETPGYVAVYYTFDNTAPVVAGTAAEVYLRGAARKGVLSVPRKAIAEQLGEKFVYVFKGGHEYEKRPVRIGGSNGTDVEILDGLKAGEKVVVGGVSFVRLAEQATVVPEGHSHNH